MYNHRTRFLFAILLLLLLCSSAQATTTLLITVQDSIDNTSISRATVFVNGANFARTNANGQVFLTHSGQNDQDIQISMTGYNDWSQTVSRNTTSILVNLSRKTLTYKINLYDSDTLSPVSGARVNLTTANVSQMKQTDASGSATFAVMASTIYSYEITSTNYESRSGTFDMGTQDQEVQFKLLSGNSFSFVVTDKDSGKAIPGAEVRLNTVLFGKTDERGILITPITRGKSYSIELRKDGYTTYSEVRTISGTDAIYYVTMSKAPVGAFVYVVDESKKPLNEVYVYINGTLSGSTGEYGRMSIPNLVTGDYLLEVRKTGYLTQNKAVTITGNSQDFTFTLPYESSALTVYVQDQDKKVLPNTSISIDGTAVGSTDNNGQLLTRIPFNTDVNITAIKDGYASQSASKIVASGNPTSTVTLVMNKNMDWGLISMIVMGAIGILILFAVIRILGRSRGRHHIMRRNEI